MYLGLFLPLNYIIVQAQQEGMSDYLASKMLVIINAASCKSSRSEISLVSTHIDWTRLIMSSF